MTTGPKVRPPAVAGTFYPDDPGVLARDVDALLDEAGPGKGPAPKALVVPHAGYIYSGPIAARAYARVREMAPRIERVVLLGPAHRVRLDGLALPEAAAFRSPLGIVPVEAAARERLRDMPGLMESDDAHEGEHSLEVQLPFLQRVLGSFELVPIAVGDATPDEVARVLQALWGGDETLVVVSTDLSHYLTWDVARAADERTARRIEAGSHVDPHQACGAHPLNGLLKMARDHRLAIERIDLRSSGDTAGTRDRVVGYGAFAMYPKENA